MVIHPMKLKVIIEDKHLTEIVETFTTMFLKDQHLKGEYTFSEVPTEKIVGTRGCSYGEIRDTISKHLRKALEMEGQHVIENKSI